MTCHKCDCHEYTLPKLNIHYHKVESDTGETVDRKGQMLMFPDASLSLKDAAKEKRESMDDRIEQIREIVTGVDGQMVIWATQNGEQQAIERMLKSEGITYSSLYGNQNIDAREDLLTAWKKGETRAFVSKPTMYGAGVNMQQCNQMIFAGIDYKFYDMIQSIHRIYRFLQERPCHVHIIYTQTESEIMKTLNEKWDNHKRMVKKMTDIIKKYGLSHIKMEQALTRKIDIDRQEVSGDGWTAVNNDCVDEAQRMEENSVGLVHTSIPFCYDEKTDVLTKDGWRSFEQVRLGNYEIATVSKSGCLEYQKPTSVVWERYSGEMIHFSGRSFNLLVTPNHRMFVAKRVPRSFNFDQFNIVSAEYITNEYESATRKSEKSNGRILRGWKMCLVPPKATGIRPKKINIPPLPDHIRNGHGVQLYWVETKDFMRLAGWYLSEGHADSFEKGRAGGRISIGQCVEKNNGLYKSIEALMVRIGLPPSLSKNQISVWCRNLAYFLQEEFGHGARNKKIPRWVMDLHPSLLTILRDTMMNGDGSKDGSSYASISRRLRDDFQELCVKTGWRAALTGTKVINTGSTQIFPEIRSIPKRKQYSGMIGCATVPNGTMVVRRNGQTCVSGNSNHYEYTPSYLDFGYTDNNDHFWSQMDYLTPELYRVLQPGRIYACHVKDRILFGNVTGKGAPTVSPFHAECIFHGIKHGFDYMGLITVVTDVVRENNQTYRLGWTEQCKDATKMGAGSPEYIVLFRKPQTDRSRGYADVPVEKSKEDYSRSRWQVDAHAFWRSSGDRFLNPEEMATYPADVIYRVFREYNSQNLYDYEHHVELGEALDEKGSLPATFMSLAPVSHHPEVWTDINRMRTLNSEQARRNLTMHICLAEGSLVLTKKDGHKPIENIEPGDMVLTHKGRWRPVLAKRCTGYNDVVDLKAQGVCGFKLTSAHKVWAKDSRGISHPKQVAMKATAEWKKAQDLNGCYVNLKLPAEEYPENSNPLHWWIVGRWIADGHFGVRGDAFISVGKHKRFDFETMVGDMVGPPAERTALQYRLRQDEQLMDIIKKCGSGAANKKLPPEAFSLPKSLAAKLIEGYLSGDGHFNSDRNKWYATSVSRELLLGLVFIVQRVYGHIACIHEGRAPGTTEIEGRVVNTQQEWVLSWGHNNYSFSFSDDDGAWKKVKSVNATGKATTWSIQVEEDESYTAEGCVVKNCPLQHDIVDRIITRFSNKDDLVFDPFGGLMTVPVRAIRLGRRGYASELNPDYWRDGLRYLRNEEQRQNNPTLFDFEKMEVTA